ncbi:MAG TPA: lipopolysaccharide heptosyltransferase II [Prosthecobacter sp.]|nr:lipopolysaccharide heptosyltransferase II [Prosthecobacter sp.]
MGNPKTQAGKTLQRIGQWLIYATFRSVEGVLRVLSVKAVWRLGWTLGSLAYFLAGKYRRLALNNLRIAFGREKPEAERVKIAKEHFASLFANILCGIKLPLMGENEVVKHVTVEGREHAQAIADSGKPILYLVCHLSCWELLTQVPSLFACGMKPATIYQPLRNPFLNALVLRRRQKLGYAVFDRQEGFNGPMKHLREGGCLGVLVDQHAGDHGIWCPFFDRLASTTPIAAMMAQRTGSAVLPIAIYDDGPGRWRLVCSPPVTLPGAARDIEAMTTTMNLAVERMIRHKPSNWFWVHNRWKTPKPQFLLRHYRRGIASPPGYDMAKLQPFELLVRTPNWLGDACMAFPAIRAMKAGRPDLKLTIFGPEKLRELWEAQPEIDRYIGKPAREGWFAVARRIRASGVPFDAGILLTNSTRSTLEFWLAGIPRIVGYKGSFRSKLLHQTIKEPKVSGPPKHHALRYLHIARTCGAETDGVNLAPALPPATTLKVGICAGAEYGPAKRWPLERFAEVILQVAGTHQEIEWLFFGAPGEAAMGEQLSGMVAGVRHINLVGKTRLSELIGHLRACRLLLTNDTGTMHLAAALGTPTVSIFGSTEPVLTGPLGNQHTVIRYHVPCSPCFKRECPFGHYECMMKVTPEQVAAAVRQALQPPAHPQPAREVA